MLPRHKFTYLLNTTLLTGLAIVILGTAVSGVLIIGNRRKATGHNWYPVLQEHLTKYPAMQLEDIYKLIYQATYGPTHLGMDRDAIRRGIETELATITPRDEPLLEFIGPDRFFVRLNLKSYKYHNGNLDSLTEIVYQSAQLSYYSATELEKRWQMIGNLINLGKLPYERSKYDSLSKLLIARDYAPIHHSTIYRQTYQPAYRVIAWEIWQRSTTKGKPK